MPPTEIFDDTVEPTSSSDNTKQVTFSNTTSSHEYKDTSDEQVTPPPKKTSRIVWQEHVEVLEWINENQNPESGMRKVIVIYSDLENFFPILSNSFSIINQVQLKRNQKNS